MNIDNLTPRAREALVIASQIAKSFDHSYVGTDHILLGLLRLDHGPAIAILKDNGVNIKGLYQAGINALTPSSPSPTAPSASPTLSAAVDDLRKAVEHLTKTIEANK